MTNKDKLQTVVMFLETNGEKAPRDIKKLLSATGDIVYSKQTCQQIADYAFEVAMQLAARTYRAAKPALNADAADAIKEILKNWKALSAHNADVLQFEIQKKINEVEKRAAVLFDLKKEIPMSKSIKSTVYRYLDETIQIAQLVLQERKLTEGSDIHIGIALLKEIKALTVTAIDDRSKEANEYAACIIADIKAWRNTMQDGLLTAEDNAVLSASRAVANKWRQILRIPSAKECVKDNDRVQYTEETRFTDQIRGKLLDERVAKFFDLLAQRKNVINETGGALYRDLEAANAELSILEQEDSDIMTKYENGEITIRAWNDRMEANKRKLAIGQKKITNLKRLIAQDVAMKAKMNEVIENFKVLQYYYDMYILSAPTTVFDIFGQLEYSAFVKVLNNNATEEETDKVKVGLGAAIEAIRVYDARFAKSNADILNIVNKETNAQEYKEEETEEMLRKKFLEEKAKRQSQTAQPLRDNVNSVDRMTLGDEDN